MIPSATPDDARRIWQAGVDAVRGDRLVAQHLTCDATGITLGETHWATNSLRRIVVIGAGKAVAGMAAGAERVLIGDSRWSVDGWVNVPAPCVRPLRRIHVHAARAAQQNEPSVAGLLGSAQIIQRVQSMQAGDACLCLISGGGSALLPSLRDGVQLADLVGIARAMSAAGATIQELNVIRQRLSLLQGGGLARLCHQHRLVTLVISDIMGDPLSLIASGPTYHDDTPQATAAAALAVWDRYAATDPSVFRSALRQLLRDDARASQVTPPATSHATVLVGNNDTAVAAAAQTARALGYQVLVLPRWADHLTAEESAHCLLDALHTQWSTARGPWCILSGGEPVVRLAPLAVRGRGGRNQQLVLAAWQRAWEGSVAEAERAEPFGWLTAARWTLLSGGTDGEDGPTDAAGAWLDDVTFRKSREQGVAGRAELDRHLKTNDAYPWLERHGLLLRTGPTETNVCDLRIALLAAPPRSSSELTGE